jgi:hypothetical protein
LVVSDRNPDHAGCSTSYGSRAATR